MKRSHWLGTITHESEIDIDDVLRDDFDNASIFAWLVGEDRAELWSLVQDEFSKEIEEMIEEATEE